MRLTVAISVMLLCAVCAKAQSPVSFTFGRSTMAGDVVARVENGTQYRFVVDYSSFDRSRVVDMGNKSLSLTELLDRLVAGTDHGYIVKNEYIIINKKTPVAIAAPVVYEKPDGYVKSGRTGDPHPVTRPAPDSVEVVTTKVVKADIPRGRSSYTPLVPELWSGVMQPGFAVKTNLLYGAGTLTPNLGFEAGVGRRSTIEFSGGWNPWNKKRSLSDYRQFMHWLIRSEYRWWYCERFSGHFFGAHVFGGRYNVSGYTVPLMFNRNYRYDGWTVGAGISYGYNLPLSKRWGLEFNVGIGGAYMNYDRYDCQVCATEHEPQEKFYFGPTRLGVSLIFMIK